MKRLILPVAAVALLGVVALSPTRTLGGVYAPGSTVEGKTIGEWGDAWWKWAFSSTDPSYVYGQDMGKVVFLTGMAPNDPDKNYASVTVSAGKPLIIPIWNNEWSDYEGFGNTLAELMHWNAVQLDQATSVSMTIDGVDIPHAEKYREGSVALQNMVLPVGNLWFNNTQPQPIVLAQEGFWMGVEPLSPGEHTIHFAYQATYPAGFQWGPDPSMVDATGHTQGNDIALHVTVVPEPAAGLLGGLAVLGLLRRPRR